MSGEALWYLNRSTGLVLLVLSSLTVVLGVVVRTRGRLPGLPRFGVVGLHRSTSLLTVGLLAVHVGTAVVDSYVDLDPIDVVVPFVAGYQPLAVGLGTLTLDLMLLIVGTSLLRGHLSLGAWRWVHRTAWLVWPIAFGHGLAAGTDLGSGWLLGGALACAVAVLGAGIASVLDRRAAVPAQQRASVALAAATTAVANDRPLAVSRNG